MRQRDEYRVVFLNRLDMACNATLITGIQNISDDLLWLDNYRNLLRGKKGNGWSGQIDLER